MGVSATSFLNYMSGIKPLTNRSDKMSTDNGSLLSGYLTRCELAYELRCSQRTIARYEQQPNGLPYMIVAGRRFYEIKAVRDWLRNRTVHPNPTRRAG